MASRGIVSTITIVPRGTIVSAITGVHAGSRSISRNKLRMVRDIVPRFKLFHVEQFEVT
jgi:uncharacterized protein YqfB (UPF0267 family)